MAGKVIDELRKKTDTAFANIRRQLQGMEPYLDRSDAPGEWTTREVLSHLLGAPGWDPIPILKSFADKNLSVVEIEPSQTNLTEERRRMSLRQLVDALDAQRQAVFAYLDPLSDADVQQRKATIPLFKQFMGTDEIPMATYLGGMFDFHWNNHAEQLAKIRKAAGLSAP
jgi:hypothetical protein